MFSERPKELGKQKLSVDRYSSTLEAHLTRDQHTALTPSTESPETPFISAVENNKSSLPAGKNPFDDIEDDFSKKSSRGYPAGNNPFFEGDEEDDDYDKNLNPFSRS